MRVGGLLEGGSGRPTIEATAPVSEAAARLKQPHLRALIVTEDEHVVGIITRRDIFERVIALQRPPQQTTVAEVMTCKLVTATLELAIEEAVALMASHGIRHLPVIDGDGEVAGLLCYDELTDWLAADRAARISDLIFYIEHG